MTKSEEVLSKIQQKNILQMWNGSKTREGVKNARKVAETLSIPRSKVMRFLESQKLASYSRGSYC